MFSITKGGPATVLLIDDDDQVRAMCKSFWKKSVSAFSSRRWPGGAFARHAVERGH